MKPQSCTCCCHAGEGCGPHALKMQHLNFSIIPQLWQSACSDFLEELSIQFYMQRKIVEALYSLNSGDPNYYFFKSYLLFEEKEAAPYGAENLPR